MALIDLANLITGAPALRQRFAAARLQAAWNVLNEATTATNHVARAAWAGKIVTNYEADLDREYRRFLSNTTIQTSGTASTDNDIQFVVNSFVDTYAAG